MKIAMLIASMLSGQLTGGQLATGDRYAQEAQALTRAAPTEASFTLTASMSTFRLTGFRVMVCADAGQTLSGAGTLQAYLLDEKSGLVARNNDLDLSVDEAGDRCQAFPDFAVAGSRAEGRVIFAATGVTVSGGTVTVFYRGYAAKGDQ
jgi:hypothetical protein